MVLEILNTGTALNNCVTMCPDVKMGSVKMGSVRMDPEAELTFRGLGVGVNRP
jgi:hypothetical protein